MYKYWISRAFTFQDALLSALSNFVPIHLACNHSNFPYWFIKKLQSLVWKKNKAYSFYLKNKTRSNYVIFTKLWSQYKSQSKLVYNDFIHCSERNIEADSKYFWKWVTCNTLSHTIPQSLHLDGEIASNNEDISILFSKYFCQFIKLTFYQKSFLIPTPI